MGPKAYITLGLTVCGGIGSWLGGLIDKGNMFGLWSIIGGLVGGIFGIWLGYKIANN